MRCTRLKPWLLIAGLAACSPEHERAPAAIDTPDPTTGSGGARGSGGSNGGTGGALGGSSGVAGSGGFSGSNGGALNDAAIDRTSDGAPDTPLVVIHQDANTGSPNCANDFTALGSNRLVAGGTTPSDFAVAYNAEVAASNTAGPFLLAFFGVNETNLLDWIAQVGALGPSASGAGVTFSGGHAEVPFTLGADRSLHIPEIAADFDLNLGTATSAVSLPMASIAVDGALSVGCGSLDVSKARLLVPLGAGALSFHGSTVEALMGPPTETLRGVPRSAWPLELSGKAAQVYAPGLLGDGGIEP